MHKLLFILTILLFNQGDVLKGRASWFDESWRKEPMASGLMFDGSRLEAAHRELLFGTVCKVTNTQNGKAVTVVITDRGPFAKDENGELIEGRIIDLTPAAFKKIDKLNTGVVPVEVIVEKAGTCNSWGSCKKKPFERGKTE